MGRPEAAPEDSGQGEGRRWASLELDVSSESVPEARAWARRLAEQWELGDLDWALLQLVTELVTNCVLHARTPSVVRIEQEVGTAALRCEVSDLSRLRPRRRAHSSGATTGRGLQMLERLSSSWGVQLTPTGKTMWFELREGVGGEFGDQDWEALADLELTETPVEPPAPFRSVVRLVQGDGTAPPGAPVTSRQGRAA